jgi:hypothetical protein
LIDTKEDAMTGKSQVVGHAKDTCGLMRPRFGPGQLLRDDDLRQGVDYTRDLSRLLFSRFFGCGVVCGLEVTATFACEVLTVEIGQGLALDCKGDPVHVCAKKSIVVDPRCTNIALAPPLWVVLRGAEKCCAPRAAAACDAGDGEPNTQCTRELDGFEIRVVTELSGCECGCPDGTIWRDTDCQCADPKAKCYQDHYEGKCGCSCGDRSDCDCDWIILAKVALDNTGKQWTADHQYRRFIRPALIADPLAKSKDPGANTPDYKKLYVELEQQHKEGIMEIRRHAQAAEHSAQVAVDREMQARKLIDDLKAQLDDPKKGGKAKGSG